MLHFSYLHKDTLTLFQLTIIDDLPFNSLQVPELDFLIFHIVITYFNIIYRRSPIVNNVGSEKCRIRTCKMAVLEAAAVAIEPTSQNELGYHHSVASLSHSASVRVP